MGTAIESEMNDSSDLEELLVEILDTYNSGDADRISALFTEDAKLSVPHGPDPSGYQIVGREAIREHYTKRFESIPDLRWQREDIYAGGDRGIMLVTVSGRTGSGEVLTYRGCSVCTFRGRKILKMDAYWKGPMSNDVKHPQTRP